MLLVIGVEEQGGEWARGHPIDFNANGNTEGRGLWGRRSRAAENNEISGSTYRTTMNAVRMLRRETNNALFFQHHAIAVV